MIAKNVKLNSAEKVFVALVTAIFKVCGYLKPHPVQRHFAQKVNVSGVEVSPDVFTLPPADAGKSICRINSNRLKPGAGFIGGRGGLIKIFNPETKQFVIRKVQGNGDMRMRFNDIALDYESKQLLGVKEGQETKLQVMPANSADVEYFYMYQHHSLTVQAIRQVFWGMPLMALVVVAVDVVI